MPRLKRTVATFFTWLILLLLLLLLLLPTLSTHLVRSMPRVILLTDFDETLTKLHNETTPAIANAAYTLHPADSQPAHPWLYYVARWVDDYAALLKSFPPESRTTFADEEAFAALVRRVEEASIRRVEAGGVFHGMTRGELIRAAYARDGCLLRDGWEQVFDRVSATGGRIAVISVGWSREWISHCLGGRADVEVYANEMVAGSDGKLTGYLDRTGLGGGGLWNSIDKRDYVRLIAEQEREKGGEFVVVYVGDAPTDLFSLCEADLGLVFGRKLGPVCDRLGVPITRGIRGGGIGRVEGLKEIEEWGEIAAWIDSLRRE